MRADVYNVGGLSTKSLFVLRLHDIQNRYSDFVERVGLGGMNIA